MQNVIRICDDSNIGNIYGRHRQDTVSGRENKIPIFNHFFSPYIIYVRAQKSREKTYKFAEK